MFERLKKVFTKEKEVIKYVTFDEVVKENNYYNPQTFLFHDKSPLKQVFDEAIASHEQWQNSVASLSTNNSLQAQTIFQTKRMDFVECSQLAQDTMINKAIKVITFEIFKNGGEWDYTLNDEELSDEYKLQFEKTIDKYDVENLVKEAITKALIFGSSFIYFNTNDEDTTLPLNDELKITIKKNKLNSISVLEPWQVAPVKTNVTNPTQKDYMKPELWNVLGTDNIIHSSRLYQITFFDVADILKPMFMFCGLPLAHFLRNYVQTAETTRQSISELVLRFKTDYITMTEQKINDPNTKARIKFMNKTRNNFGVALLAQGETLTQITTPLGGLSDIMSSMYELVAMSVGLPVTKFLGLSPRGFNATGEHDMNSFYDTISGYQANITTPIFNKIASIINHFELGNNLNIEYKFNPLNRLSKTEETELNYKNVATLQGMIQNGMITPEDALKAYQDEDYKLSFVEQAPGIPEQDLLDMENMFGENDENNSEIEI